MWSRSSAQIQVEIIIEENEKPRKLTKNYSEVSLEKLFEDLIEIINNDYFSFIQFSYPDPDNSYKHWQGKIYTYEKPIKTIRIKFPVEIENNVKSLEFNSLLEFLNEAKDKYNSTLAADLLRAGELNPKKVTLEKAYIAVKPFLNQKLIEVSYIQNNIHEFLSYENYWRLSEIFQLGFDSSLYLIKMTEYKEEDQEKFHFAMKELGELLKLPITLIFLTELKSSYKTLDAVFAFKTLHALNLATPENVKLLLTDNSFDANLDKIEKAQPQEITRLTL